MYESLVGVPMQERYTMVDKKDTEALVNTFTTSQYYNLFEMLDFEKESTAPLTCNKVKWFYIIACVLEGELELIKTIIKDDYGSLVTRYGLEHFMFAFCQYIGVTDQKELKTLQEQ